MKIFTVFGILFYSIVIIAAGVLLIAFSLNILPFEKIYSFAIQAQYNLNLRVIIGLCGLLLILISFSFAQLILGKFQRERTIAFTTPSGQVTVSLSAVEDLIKRLSGIIPEIRDLRPSVIASKKGIEVDLRVVLRSEASIPELTERLQEITRTKIQEVLGLEEQIIIKIHIAKIAGIEERERKKRDGNSGDSLPFVGFGRT